MVIVCLGGSAGALEAFGQFFSNMPGNSGMAFVLIQHIDPEHNGVLAGIIQHFTGMKVMYVEEETEVKSNCVYVIPSGRHVSVSGSKLKLAKSPRNTVVRMPIDYFLKSLANNHTDKSACVIFSGMGTDGTLGLKEIKKSLGMVMVQEPSTCKYDSMPSSAIETELVDFIAAPDKLPLLLNKYIHYSPEDLNRKNNDIQRDPVLLKEIHQLLKEQTGHDFSLYKSSTLYRRIERRMGIHQLNKVSDYKDMLVGNQQELDLLFKELLIGVTGFFRDQKVFKILKEKTIPQLLESRAEESSLRIWIPGCSTGEEVYSVAILIFECLDRLNINGRFKIHIFATDINENAIDVARQGIYPANISADVSSERLEKFFTRIDSNRYQIKKFIRENIVFAVQNIISDPPFTNLDMLCCRNLFIYFLPELQKDLLPMFYYSLKPGGILLLGTSETIGGFTDLFFALDSRWKIYKRLNSMVSPAFNIAHYSSVFSDRNASFTRTFDLQADLTIEKVTQRALLERYAPAAVIINRKGDIVYINGRTGKYLEPPQGKANMNIFVMAREGLRFGMDMAVNKAIVTNEEVVIKDLKVSSDNICYYLNLVLKPLSEPKDLNGLIMVIFEEKGPFVPSDSFNASNAISEGHPYESGDMEEQMKFLKAQLQSTILEMAASQENSRLVMEELQSTTEEMQSTNEELTTSKEELQSLNEELMVVNSELQIRNDELVRSDDDVRNLLNSTDLGILFLDSDLRIKRFTKKTTKIFNLIESDVGRCITDITMNVDYATLEKDVHNVLETLIPEEIQLQTKNGIWYNFRIIPYRTSANIISGVILTITDISSIKEMELSSISSRLFAESIIATIREALLVLDSNLRIVIANRSFYTIFKVTPYETEDQYIYNLGNRQWDIPKLRHLLEDILENNTFFDDYVVEHAFPHIGHKKILLNARKLNLGLQNSNSILLAMEDVTDR